MKRRSFFAVLFAPILARFAPKPKTAIAEAWCEGGHIFYKLNFPPVSVTVSESMLHYLGYACAVGKGYVRVQDRTLHFTERHPNPLRAANPVPHKTA